MAHAREMHTEEARLVFIETDMSSLGAYIICMRYVSYLYTIAYFYDMCAHTLYFTYVLMWHIFISYVHVCDLFSPHMYMCIIFSYI